MNTHNFHFERILNELQREQLGSSVKVGAWNPDQCIQKCTNKGKLKVKPEDQNERKVYQINVKTVSVIRKRENGNYPCNQHPYDNARLWEEIRYKIKKNINCIPAFWKGISSMKSGLSLGTNFTEFQYINKTKKETLSAILPPCPEMRIITDVTEWMLPKTTKTEIQKNKYGCPMEYV